jgi:hypothetical protein
MSDDDKDDKLSLTEFKKALFQLPAMKSEGALELDELKEMFVEVMLLCGKDEIETVLSIEDGTARMTLAEFKTAFESADVDDDDDERPICKTPKTPEEAKAENDALFDSDSD